MGRDGTAERFVAHVLVLRALLAGLPASRGVQQLHRGLHLEVALVETLQPLLFVKH